ncbi:MAG: nucleotide exchange factor GrpE [Treponema sp.]|nr:nucleotide exchange factor GrpE [Treponema sp.]
MSTENEEKTEVKEEIKENLSETEESQESQESQETEEQPCENADESKEDAAPLSDIEKIAALEARVEELEAQNAELKNQVLLRAADFENYRKRAIADKQDAIDYANTNLLKDLLESIDNFDRTVEAAATATDAKTIADGVSMVSKNLVNLLETKYSLASYGAQGDVFDPSIHEAIGRMEGDVEEPVLNAVYLKGYKLKDRVIRSAKVMVTVPKDK